MDWSNPAASAISGGFGIVGSGLSYLFNKKLAEQQNQYNIDMWKMQNEYNSPQAQMQRFKDAGLNPNLIYGQGTSGNASSAPQMVTPEAPDFTEDMRKIGQAFNIEGLKTARANRQLAQAEASLAKVKALRAQEEQEAREVFGDNFMYNPKTGRYEFTPHDGNRANGMSPAVNYYMYKELRDDYTKNALIPYRAALLNYQKQYLAPQVTMQNYNAKNYKSAYWIGQGRQIIGGVTDILGNFMPSKWLLKGRPGSYYAPWSGNIY